MVTVYGQELGRPTRPHPREEGPERPQKRPGAHRNSQALPPLETTFHFPISQVAFILKQTPQKRGEHCPQIYV